MFIRATREVNWNLHLKTFRSMLPWFFICDRINYARYGSAYLLEMNAIDYTHPGLPKNNCNSIYLNAVLIFFCLLDIAAELRTSFAVQRQSKYGFSAVSCDQTIEQTINRDSKTKGGLVGFTLNRSAVHRWLLAQSERAAITNKCKDMGYVNVKPR